MVVELSEGFCDVSVTSAFTELYIITMYATCVRAEMPAGF